MLRIERIFEPEGIADEDLEREDGTKTSSVHFVRFEPTPAMIASLDGGAGLSIGIDHPNYRHGGTVAEEARRSR